MPDIRNKLCAVNFDEEGKCEKIVQVRNLTEKEVKQYQSEERKNNEKNFERELEEKKQFSALYNEVEKLKERNFHLAKSIYDNFVDRGKIKDNSDFQKAYYDYVFNGREIKLEDAPTDFQAIYRKVCG